MNLRQLKSFVTVCKTGNVSRASEILHISQPALSRQIQELESQMGVAFFTREKRRLRLTEAGYLFLMRAEEMLELEERTRRDVRNADEALGGNIRIGCVESEAANRLAEGLAVWLQEHRGVTIDLYSADGNDLRRSLDEDRLDCALVLEPVEVAKYESIPFAAADRWGVVMRADGAGEKTVFSAEDFAGTDVILPRRSIVRDDIASWFGISPKAIRSRVSHNLPSDALLLVRAGLGALVCVEGSYRHRPMEGLRFLPFSPEKPCTHRFIRKRNQTKTKAFEVFWATLRDEEGLARPND